MCFKCAGKASEGLNNRWELLKFVLKKITLPLQKQCISGVKGCTEKDQVAGYYIKWGEQFGELELSTQW